MRWLPLLRPTNGIRRSIGLMDNWLKVNRKSLNAEKMKLERVEKFRKLLELMEKYKRKNQYE